MNGKNICSDSYEAKDSLRANLDKILLILLLLELIDFADISLSSIWAEK